MKQFASILMAAASVTTLFVSNIMPPSESDKLCTGTNGWYAPYVRYAVDAFGLPVTLTFDQKAQNSFCGAKALEAKLYPVKS